MRIALISRRFPPLIGGAERVLGYLAPALAESGAGHEVAVATSAIGEAGSRPGFEEVPTRRGSLTIERLATSPTRFLGTWLYMNNLRKWLERIRPDVAYVSMLKHDAYVAVGAGRRSGFPVALRPEGAGATGDLAWQGWGRGGRRIGARCRRADAFVAISKPIRSELIAADYDPARIVDLPNGVPVPDSPWLPRPSWRDAPRAVFVGRLAPEKGLDVLLAAWPIVRARWPEATLELVGDGPERSALEARASALGLGEAIRFAGVAPDVTPHLRAADLFVLPSIEEGMSIALLEAMAIGMPLIASSIPGNRRLIGDRKHGRLFPLGDHSAVAEAVASQWSDFDRARHMGRAARSLVSQKYSIEAMAREHLSVFERLIADKARGSAC